MGAGAESRCCSGRNLRQLCGAEVMGQLHARGGLPAWRTALCLPARSSSYARCSSLLPSQAINSAMSFLDYFAFSSSGLADIEANTTGRVQGATDGRSALAQFIDDWCAAACAATCDIARQAEDASTQAVGLRIGGVVASAYGPVPWVGPPTAPCIPAPQPCLGSGAHLQTRAPS